ncbi:MAG TPA: hypothetical protein VF584_11735 [Longimicrobium sp.]|jgi:hypothetical protein
MTDTSFYPSVSTLLPLDAIPPNLGFVQEGLHAVFDRLFFRDLQVQKSAHGDVGFYQLSLVIYRRLGFEIPGTGGVALVMYPDLVAGPETSIPIALSYRWQILKYVRHFQHASLVELPRLVFDALVEISGAPPPALLARLIDLFHGAAADPVQDLVNSINLEHLPSVLLTNPTLQNPGAAPHEVIDDLLAQLEQSQTFTLYELIYDYLSSADSVDQVFNDISTFFGQWVKEFSRDDFKAFLVPRCSVAIRDLSLALEFPRTLLQPVDANTGEVIDANSTLPEDQKQKSRLTFVAGSVLYSTETGFEFDSLGTFSFTTSQIGDTGLTLGFDDMKLDLSRTKNIPEATADGRPVDFVGVYVKEATIGLPNRWFKASGTTTGTGPKLVGTNLIIGTGGFSGKIGFDAAGVMHTQIGNIEAGLTAFDLRFERNAIVESNIRGWITIPGFKDALGNDATIDIRAHIAQDGDFSVTATEKDGILIRIPGVMDFVIYTLGFGREDDRFFLCASGTATLTFQIPALTFDRPISVDLKKLVIWEDGTFEIEGGTLVLPKAVTLKVGPVTLSVTALGTGSYERNGFSYKWLSFDGGVDVNSGSVQVQASGLKIYWRTDGPPLDVFMRVEGIAVDMVIPGSKSADEAAVLISGFLQVKEPDPDATGSSAGAEYAGGIRLMLPRAGIGASAAMRLNPSIPSFLIDAELSLSVPIVIGNTNLAFYAFRVLLGMHYVADRAAVNLPPDASWYEYYKKQVPLSYREGVNVDKFTSRKGFSLGAGAVVGTASDSAKAISAKLFLLLSLPDVLLLVGQAAVLGERADLRATEPPFSVVIAVTRESIQAAFGVDYQVPEGSGAILDLQALVEMGFFFQDSGAWYINAGVDTPASKRITARILTLFDAWSYLMLSASGIRAGAGVSWDFAKGFGPVRFEAHVYLDTQGRLSFKPKQIGGRILMGGSAAVKVFKFKMGVSLAAALAAEAPKPFIVTGSVSVELDLPKPVKKLGGTFTLDFTWTFDSNLETAALPVFNEDAPSEAARAVCVATRERFALNVAPGAMAAALPPPPTAGWSGSFDDFVVPLDSTIDVEFKRPVAPGPAVTNIGVTGTGFANADLVPPQRGKSPQVRHEYVVEEVRIRSWNPAAGRWDDYDVYGALTPLAHLSFVDPADLAGLREGWWQADQPGRVNKLSLLSQTPLSYVNDTAGPFIPENSGITTETLFCPEPPRPERCVAVDGPAWPDPMASGRRYAFDGVDVRLTGGDGRAIPFPNTFGHLRGVALRPGWRLEIVFPEPAARVRLKLATLSDGVTVHYRRRRQTGVNPSHQPVYDDITMRSEVADPLRLQQPLVYDAPGAPIDRVVIEAGECDCRDGPTAVATAPAGGRPPWPDRGPPPPAPPAPPPCGSLEAYFAMVCAEVRGQLAALEAEVAQLLAQAAEHELLADGAQGECCSPALAVHHHGLAEELRAEADELRGQMEALAALLRCCPGAVPLRGDTVGEGLGGQRPPRQDYPPCNLDRSFDYGCATFFFGFCWLPAEDAAYNATIPGAGALLASNTAMVTAINRTLHPIWRLDTLYAVTLQVVDRVTVDEQGISTAARRYLHLGFRTRGPLGHFHPYRAEYQALLAADRADQFRLQSLKPYIDFAHSYPSADGNVLNAKPLYYVEPRLRLAWLHPYVATMFGGQFDAYNGNPAVSSTLEVAILDPVDPRPAPGAPGEVPPVYLAFTAGLARHSPPDVKLLNNLATQGDPCTGVGQGGIAPPGVQATVSVERLKPRKLYLAVFTARFGAAVQEVHRENFRTSRYADHPEQVNSYRLADADGTYLRDAVYDDVAVTLDAGRTAQLVALLSHAPPSGDPLEREYGHPFDRLAQGVLRLPALDPPVGTDFTIVRDAAGGGVLGFLVRSPEPLIDPRITDAGAAPTLVLTQRNAPPVSFTTVHSKDRAMAFVGHPGLNVALHDLDFTFTLPEWNGAAWAPASVVTVTLFLSPPVDPTGPAGPALSPGGVTQ